MVDARIEVQVMPKQTVSITQEGAANALALNKDHSHVVIAGRNVFKVFSIEEDGFSESCNLRVGKNLNLNFSCNDVAWNTADDNMLATAATNGAVVLWNLARQTRSKQDHVFVDHKRTVNKVSFNSFEPYWLISGSQDGTMKLFDVRVRELVRTFISNTESVRDVQFSPHVHHTFAAVSENGNVQMWDIRRPDRYQQQFTAHSGPIFACDWHADVPWLATASRDRTIKIWDLTVKPTLEHTIHTIASVGHVKWRPQRKYHIASCALVVDCSVNVWDIRRPYIPFASFYEHKDVATGVAWRGDPHSFLSTSRDCTLIHHVFKDAQRPANTANPQGVAINGNDDIAFAYRTNVSCTKAVKLAGILRKSNFSSELFTNASSTMQYFTSKSTNEKHNFCEAASRYLLTGRSFQELCDYNANVARNLGRIQISMVWNILKTLYFNKWCEFSQLTPSGNASRDETNLTGLSCIESLPVVGLNVSDEQRLLSGAIEMASAPISGDDETETDETPEQHLFGGFGQFPNSTAMFRGDFLFGDGEMDPLGIDFNIHRGIITGSQLLETHTQQEDWTLQPEAFALRHEIQDRSPPPEQLANHSTPDLNDNDTHTISLEEQPQTLLNITNVPRIMPWDPTSTIIDTLKHHANVGDIQTTVSILLVLGEKRNHLTALDEATQEHWLLGYLELLWKHRLWLPAAQVVQLAWLPSINQLSQQSTTIHTGCSLCGKLLLRAGWLCDRCHNSQCALCSICHQVVRGLYVWCQGCSHGGHIGHMQEWWKKNRYCPTGCGHQCKYT